MTEGSRPTGVTVLAVVAVVVGVTNILAGLGDVGIAGGNLGNRRFGETLDEAMTGVGLVLVAVGVLGVGTGYGLLRGHHWAWLIARLWASVSIIAGVVGVGLSLLSANRTDQILATVIGSTGAAIVAAVVLWYLYRPHVKAAFGRG